MGWRWPWLGGSVEGEWFLATLKFRLFKVLPLVGNSLIMAWSPFKSSWAPSGDAQLICVSEAARRPLYRDTSMGRCLIASGFSSIFPLTIFISHSFFNLNASRTHVWIQKSHHSSVCPSGLRRSQEERLKHPWQRVSSSWISKPYLGTFPEAFSAQLADCWLKAPWPQCQNSFEGCFISRLAFILENSTANVIHLRPIIPVAFELLKYADRTFFLSLACRSHFCLSWCSLRFHSPN